MKLSCYLSTYIIIYLYLVVIVLVVNIVELPLTLPVVTADLHTINLSEYLVIYLCIPGCNSTSSEYCRATTNPTSSNS